MDDIKLLLVAYIGHDLSCLNEGSPRVRSMIDELVEDGVFTYETFERYNSKIELTELGEELQKDVQKYMARRIPKLRIKHSL